MTWTNLALLAADVAIVAALVWIYVLWWRRRRAQHLRDLKRVKREAFADGVAFMMGEYAKQPVQTYRAVLVTPDAPKPRRYWANKSVEDICVDFEISRLLDEAAQ